MKLVGIRSILVVILSALIVPSRCSRAPRRDSEVSHMVGDHQNSPRGPALHMVWGQQDKRRRVVGSVSNHERRREGEGYSKLPQGLAEGEGRGQMKGQMLSPIGQEEQGVNPRGQPCPNYGLNETEFLVVGFTEHYWRKTVEIRSLEGRVLGIVKRGCPAWTNSFVWKVPQEHASGCRDHVDPSVFSSKCQMPETEVLYTDEFSGLLNPASVKIMDCHDDQIFTLYEEHREVIVHDYKIHSDFVVQDLNGNVMGYCRQDQLPHAKAERSLVRVGQHNFTIVDLEGEAVASAIRPLHWPNGATEHAWHVTIHRESIPLTLSDVRIVAVAVVNNVLLHEEDDWCSDIVFALTPILLTLTAIAIIAALSTCYSWAMVSGRG